MTTARYPIPTLSGLTAAFVGVDYPVAYFASAVTLTGFFPTLVTAPDGGTVAVDVRNATAGGGQGISATVPDGEKSPAAVATGSVSVAAGGFLYLRVTAADDDASDLSGYIEVQTTSGAIAAAGLLTSLATVKEYLSITSATHDVLLTRIVANVSAAIQAWLDRVIAETNYSERHCGGWPQLAVRHFPVTAVNSVEVAGAALAAGDYELDGPRGMLLRVSSSRPQSWERTAQDIVVDYDAGYVTVPGDLELAATKQAAYEFQKSASGQGRLGLLNTAEQTGASTGYVVAGLLDEVKELCRPHRRLAP